MGSPSIFKILVLLLLFLAKAVPASAVSTESPRRTRAIVDIRGFGDGAFTGGGRQLALPRPFAIEERLSRLAALRSSDVNFMNVEATVALRCRRLARKSRAFLTTPESLVSFVRAGFNLLGLANDHARDCASNEPELDFDDIDSYLSRQVPKALWHGVSAKPSDLWERIPILRIKGVRIGFVAIKAWSEGVDETVANLDQWQRVLEGLARAKVDVRILSLHGGTENRSRPDPRMVQLARDFLARYGGDIVFAHHSHRMQGFEFLRKSDGRIGAIFHSLGNFLHDGLSHRGDGMVAQLKVSRRGILPKSVRVYPLTSENHWPGPATTRDLQLAEKVWSDSNRFVETLPLAQGLVRMPFRLQRVRSPGPGFLIEPAYQRERRDVAHSEVVTPER